MTSRSALAELPGARLVGLGAPDDDDAGLELLADAAGAERVAADPDGARALVAACGGLPLAVRIVGGRLRARAGWTPSQLAARLAGERGRLDELRQGDLAVRATFRAAYDGLPEADRLVFRRAGSHPAQSFGPDAAAARAGLPPAEATAALERLADAYLVDSPEPDRYRLHDLLRLFAAETLRDAGEGADTAARLMRHLAALPGPAAADLAGLPAVLREGLDAGLREDVIALVDAAGPRQEDPFDRLAAWRAQAEATAGESGRRRARALRWVSHSYTYLGEVQRALPLAVEALAVAEAAGDRWEIAQTARRHGEALRDLDRFAESEAALQRALELFAELGEVNEEVEVRAALGVLYNVGDRHHLTVPLLERALDLLPADAENSRRGWVLVCLSGAHRAAGDVEAARRLAAEASALARRIGDRYLLGYCHQDAGWVAADAGRYDDAEAAFAAMLRIFSEIGVASGAASARAGLGVVAERRGDLDAAQAAFGAAEDEFRRLGDEIRAETWRGHRATVLGRLAQEGPNENPSE
ncbi:hypothetical protein GCM10022255_046610 [Dactylosporangium darangshiense]|uniref:Tetratricopeptide repeat protein n=1 Tax=Dactylosporangium darangshiense TaxID=579108 RepID=A0ABP8DBF6_9ACTN